MSNLRTPAFPKRRRPIDLDGFPSLSRTRDRTVRKVAARTARKIFTGERQALLVIYLRLTTSRHRRDEIAEEFLACYEALLKGAPLADLPLRLLDKKSTIAEIKKATKSHGLLGDPT